MKTEKHVLIASDHAGVALKTQIMKRMPGWEWEDLGPKDLTDPVSGALNTPRVDYPDYAELLANKISAGQANRGILICGSGIGMSIAANKISGIRAALVENPIAARLSREHNDANVLCLGSRFVAPEYGSEIVEEWLKASFSNDPRHCQRIQKVEALENKNAHHKVEGRAKS